MGAIYSAKPINVIYASSAGIVLDGATEQTTQIQAILDSYGSAGKYLRFVLDGPVLVDTIYLWSNQHLDGIGNASILKKPYSSGNLNSGFGIIQNKHPVAYGAGSIVDQYITVSNLYVDGNRRNGGSGAAYPNYINSTYGNQPSFSRQGYYVCTIQMNGVNYLQVQNVVVYDSPGSAMQLSNVQNATTINFGRLQNYADSIMWDCGILGHNGGCTNCHAYNLWGQATDDPFYFNALDLLNFPGNNGGNYGSFAPGTVADGPIEHCSINQAYFTGPNLTGGRFASVYPFDSSSIKRCTIRDVTFVNPLWPTNISNSYPSISGATATQGYLDNIKFENLRYEIGASTATGIIVNGMTIDNMVVDGLEVVVTGGSGWSQAMILQAFSGLSSIGSLWCRNVVLQDPGGYCNQPPVVLAGTCSHASFEQCRVNRGTTQLAQPFVQSSGTTGRVQFSGGWFDHINNVLQVTGGTTSLVQSACVSHTNGGTGGTFYQNGGTLAAIKSVCTETALLASPSGLIGTNT